jgi:hypothetical protein
MLPVLHFGTPDDEDTSGHAPAPPLTIVSERYFAGVESKIQTAAKTLSLLHKHFNKKRMDDLVAAAEVKRDGDEARSHLHELEGRMDAYMMEASRARPHDQNNTRKRHAPTRSSRKNNTDGSDDEEIK